MATKTYEVKIGTTNIEHLKSYDVERSKLWTDADRNMAGELKATFIGVFPKINLNFISMVGSDLKTYLALLEASSFSVSWWDVNTTDYKTGNYYAGDFKYSLIDDNKDLYAPFSVSLIPFKKI